MHILVTGGAGYIGSHTCVELLQAGHRVTVVDNLVNGSAEALKRVERITGKSVDFHQFDLIGTAQLDRLFAAGQFDAVIHFAGLKAVGESVGQPLRYYRNNLDATLSLCEAMGKHGVRQLVFSSSATVYGDPASVPINESAALHVTNPYGRTKLMIEDMLRDLAATKQGWRITILRYFNPIGAHPSGLIGEDPHGPPNNLVPFVAQTAVGKRPHVNVFGDDYDTPDGTGVRDYIHVVDLARGHLAALKHPAPAGQPATYNLGTGTGYSVLETIAAFELASGQPVAYQITSRRPGDIATCYADASKAARELDWRAEKTLDKMCADAWRWQRDNPDGYNNVATPASATPNIYTGSVLDNTKDWRRGWLTGDFMDKATIGYTEAVEIKWGVHRAGEVRKTWVRGVHDRTYTILVSGKFREIFRDREVVLEHRGDYVAWGKGVDHKWKAEADTTVIVIRWPSIRG